MEAENEVFELCKQVYEATGLADTIDYFYLKNNGDYSVQRANHIQVDHNWWKLGGEVPTGCFPLYTSDYLLEKLPLEKGNYIGLQIWSGGNWGASWQPSRGKWHTSAVDDTPLKALLKLTIKLHEEGLL